MTKKAPAAKAGKKDDKKAAPAGAEVPKTGELALNGGKDGKTMGLDNKTPIKVPVPPKVAAAAKVYAEALDRIDYHKTDAEKKGAVLTDLYLDLGKGERPTVIRVDTDAKAHYFHPEDLFRLRHSAKSSSTAVEA